MSTYSDAWHNADPQIQQFCHSFAQLKTFYLGPFWDPDEPYPYGPWQPFSTLGQTFPSSRGRDIYYHNLTAQIWDVGFFDRHTLLLGIPLFTYNDQIEPYYDPGPYYSFADQFTVIPDVCYPYPRPKFKIRRTYWTGTPRRRRNLP